MPAERNPSPSHHGKQQSANETEQYIAPIGTPSTKHTDNLRSDIDALAVDVANRENHFTYLL